MAPSRRAAQLQKATSNLSTLQATLRCGLAGSLHMGATVGVQGGAGCRLTLGAACVQAHRTADLSFENLYGANAVWIRHHSQVRAQRDCTILDTHSSAC